MKTKFTFLMLGLLLLGLPGRCFAEYGVMEVSRADAKEMGITIRTNGNGDAGIQVTMEFAASGKLQHFTHAQVQIGEGKDRIMSASLREDRSSAGSVTVRFSADPAYLSRSMLWVYVRDAPLGGTAYRLKVKDFLEPERAKVNCRLKWRGRNAHI